MSPVRDPEFRKLWGGQMISEIGSRISREGLPLTAVMLLGATPAQMGVLAATGGASTLLLGLGAGVLVDRMRRRPVMIASDLGRAVLLATIPLAAARNRLSFTQVLLIAALSGMLTVLFDVAYQSYLPSLLPPENLMAGNRLLGMSSATAEVIGPGVTGVLVSLVTAPRAVLLDAISFLFSAASVAAIRRPEEGRPPSTPEHWWAESVAGARVIRAHPVLRALALRSITAFFSAGGLFSLYVLFAIRTLHISTPALGLTIALGGMGSFVGAFAAERVSRWLGEGRAFFAAALAIGLMNLLIPLAASMPRYAVLLLGTAQLFGDAAWSIYFVNETTLRQHVTPAELLGRVNAAMQIASRGMLPLGALAGGLLANAIGIPQTLWIGACGVMASCLWLWPVRGK